MERRISMGGLSGDILITGGAGFLARAIYQRARDENWDAQFTALSRDDAKHAELQRRFPEVRSILCDVADHDGWILSAAMMGHQTVIHAAASKYVDRAELSSWDTVRTNVYGSQGVAEAVIGSGVERVVGISTDKACEPVNVYGMTKAVMERLFQEADRLTDARFTVVRYGNVIGSTGSVVPLFRKQLADDGKIRLTNPRMTRFWMAVGEAVDLIVGALADEVPGGHVLIPSPRALEVGDLVRIALGMEPGEPFDERVEIIGERPGEKRHEKLIHRQESTRASGPYSSVALSGVHMMAPPGVVLDTEPFELVSSDPPKGWMPLDEMVRHMAEAEAV
jgi:UDP-N-acetylglucosamine 4,6-dehydratase